jgi:anti-anti-sigma regulatory factor
MMAGPESGIQFEKSAVRFLLRGEITLSDITNLRVQVMLALEAQQDVLINCSEATYFDTDALQILASLRVEARAMGIPLQIEGLPGSVLANASPRGNTPNPGQRLAG